MHTFAVKVDAVSRLQYERLAFDGNLQCPAQYIVKFLTIMVVLCVFPIAGQWSHLHDEWVNFSVAESHGQTLVLIVIVSVHLGTLTGTGDKITTHACLFTEDEHIQVYAIALGDA